MVLAIQQGEIQMKVLMTMTALAMGSFAGIAAAHTHLKSSVPAEGSTVTAAPKEIVLNFGEPVRLTALSLQKDGADEVKLTLLPKDAAAKLSVAVPALDAGHYAVNWRILGDDGHVMIGKVEFTVGAKAEMAAPHAAHEGY
jgi:methionine-rich copper-binding protein CopC